MHADVEKEYLCNRISLESVGENFLKNLKYDSA